jgi:putative component of toxin-antitoxin plasmid stabilization module
VYQLQQTEVFGKWLFDLRDVRAKARILARLESVRLGNLGDVRRDIARAKVMTKAIE